MLLWSAVLLCSVLGLVNVAYVIKSSQSSEAHPEPSTDDAAACSLQDPAACKTLFRSPAASLIAGIPNSWLGGALYLATGGTAFVALFTGALLPALWLQFLLLACVAAMVMSLWLAYSLIFIRKTVCVPCFCGHALNLLLLILVAFVNL
ncbi:MAG: hypothetical protein GEEBNDBF_00585 [bacterium]|nr:hypothetical protein [bacterium]